MSVFTSRKIIVPVLCDPVFANNSWERIIANCQSNTVPNTWKIGDSNTMTINGVEYTIDIIGKNHDTYSDGTGKAPLTFQMHYGYADRLPMNSSDTNSTGWENCAMRLTHLPEILTKMPLAVQYGVKAVNKLTSAGNQSSNIVTTSDKLFLLSEVEVFGTTNYSFSGEGTRYAYYAEGRSTVKNKIDAGTMGWWERSPRYNSTSAFCNVGVSASSASNTAASTLSCVAFAFCF